MREIKIWVGASGNYGRIFLWSLGPGRQYIPDGVVKELRLYELDPAREHTARLVLEMDEVPGTTTPGQQEAPERPNATEGDQGETP